MVPKRKRNVKVEATEEYKVVSIDDLDISNLEEFTLPPIDTGMEAEEEKELHLKKIIDSGSGTIPIPVIKKIKNPAKNFYKKKPVAQRYVNWKKDVDNEFYLQTKDKALCSQLGITEEKYLAVVDELEDDAYVKIENEDKLVEIRSTNNRTVHSDLLLPPVEKTAFGEEQMPIQESVTIDNTLFTSEPQSSCPATSDTFITPQLEPEKTNKLSPIIKEEIKKFARYRRLIRDEDKAHPSYVCFRRRVLKPSRKNRRSEAQTMEKIIRLDTELDLLNKMSQLRKEVCELNDKICDVNYDIFKATSAFLGKYGKQGQLKLTRLIRSIKLGPNKLGVAEQRDIFKDILFDRERIRLINKRIKLARENIDGEEIEREAIGYTNYLREMYEKPLPEQDMK